MRRVLPLHRTDRNDHFSVVLRRALTSIGPHNGITSKHVFAALAMARIATLGHDDPILDVVLDDGLDRIHGVRNMARAMADEADPVRAAEIWSWPEADAFRETFALPADTALDGPGTRPATAGGDMSCDLRQF